MRENKLRTIWADGGTALNGWLHIPSAWSAEVMAHAGWDSVTVDMQHGMMGTETAILMLQALSTTNVVPLLRVNWNEPGVVMKMLDAGAMGIICPMIDTREQCEAFVGAVRYPPLGYRSLGPTRARVYAGADYAEHANDTVLAIAMVETKAGLESVAEIAATPGLDGIMIGAGDLRFSMFGEVGLDGAGEEFKAALQRILDACTANDIVGGIFTASPEYAREMIANGFRFVTVKSDTLILTEFAKKMVDEARG
jgi:4-hydroxy-2-oxoheptanedioate aldolase